MTLEIPSKILIVDTDETNALNVEIQLKKLKINSEKTYNWENAIYLFNTQRFDAAIISLDLGGMLGTTLIQKWRNHEIESKRHCTFILTAGIKRSKEDEFLVKEIGDIPILTVPVNPALFLATLTNAKKLVDQNLAIQQLEKTLITPLLKQNNVEKILQTAKEKLEHISPKGIFRSATLHRDFDQSNHAIELLQNLIKDDPQNMKYQNELAMIYLKLGNLAEAQKILEAADKLAPKQIERLNSLASIYVSTHQGDKAVEKFRELITLNPDQADLKFKYFEKLLENNLDENAKNLFNETSTPAELTKYYNNQGVTNARTGQPQKALNQYQQAIRLIPNSEGSYKILFNMALARISLGGKKNMIEAKILLEKCLELDPNYVKAKEKLDSLKL